MHYILKYVYHCICSCYKFLLYNTAFHRVINIPVSSCVVRHITYTYIPFSIPSIYILSPQVLLYYTSVSFRALSLSPTLTSIRTIYLLQKTSQQMVQIWYVTNHAAFPPRLTFHIEITDYSMWEENCSTQYRMLPSFPTLNSFSLSCRWTHAGRNCSARYHEAFITMLML